MKKTTTLTLLLFSFIFVTAQENIPLLNGNIEDTTTPLTPINDDNFGIQGFRIFRSLVNNPTKLDVVNSGLAPGEGVGGSQALKGVTQNTAGNAGNVSLFSDLIDISNRGNGTYTFSFFVKTYVQPVNNRPLFIVVVGYDENDVKITNITAIDNGGTQNTTGITADFVEQSITVELNDTSIKKLSLQVQFAKEDNTFLFDNFTLTGPDSKIGLNENEIIKVNPLNLAEILAEIAVPATGSPTATNFTLTENGSPLVIESVFIRNETTLVVKLKSELVFPREVTSLPTWQLTYNGNDQINDASGNSLGAFQKDVSILAYAENLWKYWGEFEKVDSPYKKPWRTQEDVIDGWDWSLPDFVEANGGANIRLKESPNTEFPCSNLGDVKVSWNELEPTEGIYNWQLLRDRIMSGSIGYDGVVLRILASVWKINSYPVSGEFVPKWLEERENAPRWMDNLPIAKIESHKAIDGKYMITNMDIMDPDYHSRYLKFIEALGKSGIPEMEQLKIVNVCYRSASAGEEFTAYDPTRNSTEAQYSTEIVHQRTRERLTEWANAFAGNKHKLMYVGTDEEAQIGHAGSLGIGSRNGFVEMYNGFVQMSQFGMTINSDRYADVDENNDFIKRDVAFGDENEEYNNEERFGWKESFPYRYYTASFRMLQQRRNYVMHAENTLNPELTWYLGLELARRVEDTPDAWAMLSEYYLSRFANEGNAGPLKNIERWVTQRDKPGYLTTPTMQVPTAKDLWYNDTTKPYDFTARKGKNMGFYVDDRMFPGGEQPMAIKISFYDGVAGTLKLIYENNEGVQEKTIATSNTDQVKTATFFINAKIDNTSFDNDFDFILKSEEEVPVFFVRVIKTQATYTLSLEKTQKDSKINIYPNPVKSSFVLKSGGGINKVSVYSITGALVNQVKVDGRNAYNIDVSHLKSGIYIVSVKNSKGIFNIKISKI